MRDFFISLKIRVKLLSAFGSILLLSVLLIVFSISSINSILFSKEINEEVDLLKLHLETLDLSAKEFLHEGYKSNHFQENYNSPLIDTFQSRYLQSKQIMTRIEQAALRGDVGDLTNGLTLVLDSLNREFQTLVALHKKRGFRDFGSEGALRKSIHEIENSGFNIDKVNLLTLRRHEKDFFLRKDLRYQEAFNKSIAEFREQLAADKVLQALVPAIENYQTEFNNVVQIESEIGLKEDEGLRGRIRANFQKIRPKLDAFGSIIKKGNEEQIFRTKMILGILFSVQLVAGLIMAIVYANLLTKSIKEIRGAMQKLSKGSFPDKLVIKSNEEIGQTKMAFNQFVDRLNAAATFAKNMGAGKHDARYDANFADDVLASSLIDAQNTLIEADLIQKKTNWMNQGIAAFNDILKNEAQTIEELANTILKQLVQYIDANQGALYLINKTTSEEFLERMATYAYGKTKSGTQRITVGQGIIGQCVLEKAPVYLREVPGDFVKITSGLGEATPRNVLVIPLTARNVVMGVIELASFRILEPHQIEFIEKVAESIAAILSDKQIAAETKKLLHESEQKANALAQQEEEMRQNAEELTATQEEMERQRKGMQEEILLLRKQLSHVSPRL